MMTTIVEPTILVVEGDEDKLFFNALMKHLGLRKIQILSIGGKRQLRSNLKALSISPGFSAVLSLGIARDADEDPKAAFQSVHDALQAANLPAPDRHLIRVGQKPSVTVMILPDDNTPGMLEDLCLRAISNDSAIPCVEQYFQCLKQQGLDLPKNISKAKVQAFLASKIEAGKRLGEAAQAGFWPWNSNAFEQVKDFLQQVSSISAG